VIDETPAPEEVTIALDAHVSKLKKLTEASDNIKFWKGQYEKLKAELDEIMGDATIGTIDGQEILTYRYEERFRGADFRKMYPDTYRTFVTEVVEKKFDLNLFRASRPELYEEFRVRAMKNKWES
jgi:hypothetical protein